jgi:hypothetical protein
MISSAVHPRWLLRLPSWIWFPSIDFLTNAWVDWSNFLVAHWGGGNWRTFPFDDQLRHSSKMAATAAILDLVSIDFLTNWSNFLLAHWGDWRKVPFNDQRCHSFNISLL